MNRDQLTIILERSLETSSFIQASFSVPKRETTILKLVVKPIQTKQAVLLQFTEYTASQAFHHNLSHADAVQAMVTAIDEQFDQAVLFTQEADYHLLKDKQGSLRILKKAPTKQVTLCSHNRQKKYLLPEGKPIDFLVELGVMSATGKILAQKSHKFRQINRFLEIVDDILVHFPLDRPLRIVDFGCGKSYLTFALHHYLQRVKGYAVQITGLDLKEDVIAFCSQVVKKLQLSDLTFQTADIAHFDTEHSVDLVICLHACDTATDAALEKAVAWNAKAILAVPCCQHELYSQVKNDLLNPLLRHGILRERFAALVTDAARAQVLEALGYSCQIMEFIDLEHTPKNLLIRALRSDKQQTNEALTSYQAFAETLQIAPSILQRMLVDKGRQWT